MITLLGVFYSAIGPTSGNTHTHKVPRWGKSASSIFHY